MASAALCLVPSLSLTALYDARIQLDGKMRQPVPAGPVSLDRYMQLPVEQYCAIPLPMQASLVRTARPDEFEMRVPELAFRVPGKPITVAPLVVASVVSERDRVVIASDCCTLTGSSEAMRLIEATRLNDRFDFSVLTAWSNSLAGRGACPRSLTEAPPRGADSTSLVRFFRPSPRTPAVK